MKNFNIIIGSFIITTFFGLLLSCSEEDISDPLAAGYIEISLNNVDAYFPSGQAGDNELPAQLNLLISMENINGDVVWNSREIVLQKWGNSYASNSIRLSVGEYVITKFLVFDYGHDALLAAPVAGAPLAYLAENPLPVSFVVYTGETTSVTPQVLDAFNKEPEDFGYANEID